MDNRPASPEAPTVRPAPATSHAVVRARPKGRRGLGAVGVIFRSAVLAGLGWLTYENATRSPALTEAVEAETRGDYPAALRAATEHLDRRPWGGRANLIMARCLSRLDFAEQAEPFYRRAWFATTSDLRYRAYGLTRANLRERALRAYDDVLDRDPDDVAALRLKAGVLLSMTRWEAVGAIGRKLSDPPRASAEVDAPVNAAGGHWTFQAKEVASVATIGATLEGLAFQNLGERAKAAVAFEKALALDPKLASMPLDRRLFWSQLGEDLLKVGRAPDLIRHLTAADPGRTDPDLINMVALAHTQLGASAEAESCWRRALEVAPGHPAAWLNLGRLEAGRNRLEDAARLLTRAVALAPESVDAAYNLGLACRRLGRLDDAARWEREAARLRAQRAAAARAANGFPAPDPPSPTSGRPPSPAS